MRTMLDAPHPHILAAAHVASNHRAYTVFALEGFGYGIVCPLRVGAHGFLLSFGSEMLVRRECEHVRELAYNTWKRFASRTMTSTTTL